MTQLQKNMLLHYGALARTYNGFVDELNEVLLKKELTEDQRIRLAMIRIRMNIVGDQIKAVLLTLQDMGLIGSPAWKPEDVRPILCDPESIQRN